MLRILSSVDAFNERMGLNLTHHDVNWVYNLHHLMGQGYYLKSRYLEIRLIQFLPESNKGLKKGFLYRVRGMARWPLLPDKRGETKWGFRLRMVILKLPPPVLFFFFFFGVLVRGIFFNLH